MVEQGWLIERFQENRPRLRGAKVTRVEVIGDPTRLRELDIAVL